MTSPTPASRPADSAAPNAPASTPPEAADAQASRPAGLFDRPVPQMGAESGYEVISDEEVPPMRWSGFLCLLLGLLSFASAVAVPMLVVPVVAIGVGLFTLRRYDGPRPVGVRAAVLGLVLASGFGACGVLVPWLKHQTLGSEAKHFARQYLDIVAAGDLPVAMELLRVHNNRNLDTTNLDDYYGNLDEANELLQSFHSGPFAKISQYGDQIQWELDRPVRVYQQYGFEKAATYWVDKSGNLSEVVELVLQWTPARDGNEAHWHVARFQYEMELIVAPRVI